MRAKLTTDGILKDFAEHGIDFMLFRCEMRPHNNGEGWLVQTHYQYSNNDHAMSRDLWSRIPELETVICDAVSSFMHPEKPARLLASLRVKTGDLYALYDTTQEATFVPQVDLPHEDGSMVRLSNEPISCAIDVVELNKEIETIPENEIWPIGALAQAGTNRIMRHIVVRDGIFTSGLFTERGRLVCRVHWKWIGEEERQRLLREHGVAWRIRTKDRAMIDNPLNGVLTEMFKDAAAHLTDGWSVNKGGTIGKYVEPISLPKFQERCINLLKRGVTELVYKIEPGENGNKISFTWARQTDGPDIDVSLRADYFDYLKKVINEVYRTNLDLIEKHGTIKHAAILCKSGAVELTVNIDKTKESK